ncbi:MAG: hypothetical protein DME26_08060 [Verrucomicrobia bacterium]|nr:MAG: hypothetical protein DME26_08060 [Verrucomicrobiota bacterium]
MVCFPPCGEQKFVRFRVREQRTPSDRVATDVLNHRLIGELHRWQVGQSFSAWVLRRLSHEMF